MGLTLQFISGQKNKIIDAVKNYDFDFLEEIESQNRIADFSYHITPNDLNLFVNAATEVAGRVPLGLRENLDMTSFYFDSVEAGAYLVDPVIRDFFSMLSENDSANIAHKWFSKMAEQYKEDMRPENDVVLSIKQLILICKEAEYLNLDLVHVWFL